MEHGNGLRFGKHSTVLSVGRFSPARMTGPAASLEIWITPESISTDSTILAFDSSAFARLPFAIRQYKSDIAVQRSLVGEQGVWRRPWLKVDQVLPERARTLVTITAGNPNTTIYVNGVLRGTSSTVGLGSKDFTGELVVGTSTYDDSWRGEITGLAVYGTELTPSQVKRHFESWAVNRGPISAGEESPIALYLFDEGHGTVAHNRMDLATDLGIPARYSVLHPAFLHPAWDYDFRRTAGWKRWGYWQDVAVNIAGFLPFGFVWAAYFSRVRPMERSTIIVILSGALLSFMIEGLQRFLPTRDSSMDDLISNTIGTAAGALIYRNSLVHSLWFRVMAYLGAAPGNCREERASRND
jgi:hypothetical protein